MMKFYGTDEETYVETLQGLFLIQTPDGPLGDDYEDVTDLPDDATELDPVLHPDLYDMVPCGTLTWVAIDKSVFDGCDGWSDNELDDMLFIYIDVLQEKLGADYIVIGHPNGSPDEFGIDEDLVPAHLIMDEVLKRFTA